MRDAAVEEENREKADQPGSRHSAAATRTRSTARRRVRGSGKGMPGWKHAVRPVSTKLLCRVVEAPATWAVPGACRPPSTLSQINSKRRSAMPGSCRRHDRPSGGSSRRAAARGTDAVVVVPAGRVRGFARDTGAPPSSSSAIAPVVVPTVFRFVPASRSANRTLWRSPTATGPYAPHQSGVCRPGRPSSPAARGVRPLRTRLLPQRDTICAEHEAGTGVLRRPRRVVRRKARRASCPPPHQGMIPAPSSCGCRTNARRDSGVCGVLDAGPGTPPAGAARRRPPGRHHRGTLWVGGRRRGGHHRDPLWGSPRRIRRNSSGPTCAVTTSAPAGCAARPFPAPEAGGRRRRRGTDSLSPWPRPRSRAGTRRPRG